jgi:CRISPR/Cas system CSM-associated protein Csm3 (group 7 of RAMP superfamily)
MQPFRVDLAITVETALSVGGSGTLGTLADKNLLRDGWDRLILPGSQLKGRLRHACEALARSLYPDEPVCRSPRPELLCPQDPTIPAGPDGQVKCLVCSMFGSTYWPSPLRFHNLIYDPDYPLAPAERRERFDIPQDLRPGVGLERRRRVAQEKILFLIETSLPGTQPVFQADGAIEGLLPSSRHAALLLAGLQECRRWGAIKSRGLGWTSVAVRAWFGAEKLVDTFDAAAAPMKWEALHA